MTIENGHFKAYVVPEKIVDLYAIVVRYEIFAIIATLTPLEI